MLIENLHVQEDHVISAIGTVRGVEVTKAPLVYFSVSKIFILQKNLLNYLNDIYIWQVPPQLSCGDTCQI